MNRRETVLALLALGIANAPLRASAQTAQPTKQMRIGLLPAFSEVYRKWIAGFMREFGWTEGGDFNFVWFDSEYRTDKIEMDAKRIVAEKPDLILTAGDGYAIAAQQLTATIPIVLWAGGYPVEEGLANSLAHPGKNLTGNANYAGTGLWGKLVELLRDAKPSVKRIGVLFDYVPPFGPRAVGEAGLEEMRIAARAYGIALHVAEVSVPDRAPAAIAEIEAARPDALISTSGPGLTIWRQRVAQFAVQKRLPLIVDYPWPASVDPYPMLVYAAVPSDLMRRAIDYVDRILKGAKPGDLPIQQPSKFRLTVNMKTAKAIGIRIPESILVRAEEVIE